MWRKAGAGVFREGSGVQEVFHGSPAMEMKSQFRSQTEFQSAAGLCGEPGLALCAPQMFPPPEKGCCCTWEEMGPVLWNALVLYVGVGLKKKKTNFVLWKAALKIIACNLSSGKYVLGDSPVAGGVIFHSWGVNCVVLRDLL